MSISAVWQYIGQAFVGPLAVISTLCVFQVDSQEATGQWAADRGMTLWLSAETNLLCTCLMACSWQHPIRWLLDRSATYMCVGSMQQLLLWDVLVLLHAVEDTKAPVDQQAPDHFQNA